MLCGALHRTAFLCCGADRRHYQPDDGHPEVLLAIGAHAAYCTAASTSQTHNPLWHSTTVSSTHCPTSRPKEPARQEYSLGQACRIQINRTSASSPAGRSAEQNNSEHRTYPARDQQRQPPVGAPQ
jgi:hypothetical protein